MSATEVRDPLANSFASLEQAQATLRQLAEAGGPLTAPWPITRPPASASATAGTPPESQEQELRLAEIRYRVLIEQIPAVTFIASLAGSTNEIYVSPQIESLLGFTQEEWVTNPILWYTQTHPDDRAWISRDFATAIMTGQPFRGVVRIFTRDGTMRWVQTEARFVRDERGQPIFLQGAGFDVTEQFRAQEAREQLAREQAARAQADHEHQRLLQVFSTLPAAVAVLDGPDHVIEFLNPVASELAGSGASPIGKPWIEAFPEFGAETISALDSVARTAEPCFLREHQVRSAGRDEHRYFDVIFQPLPQVEGRGRQRLVYAVDVSAQVLARREIEQALALRDEALAQMQETLAMREGFLAAAAHDLKTPVAAIKGRAQLLSRQIARGDMPNPTRLVESVAAIESGATRMTAMIGELLDLARLHSGQEIQIDRRRADLVSIVQQVVEEQQGRAHRHRIRVESVEAQLMGSWDPERLMRVLSNLLDNAVKYSPAGGDILIRVAYADSARSQAAIQVQDFGVGIRQADLPHIFERFYRGANVAGRIAGTGIGLEGSYHIIQAHGGDIEATSREGSGSTFTIRLPIAES